MLKGKKIIIIMSIIGVIAISMIGIIASLSLADPDIRQTSEWRHRRQQEERIVVGTFCSIYRAQNEFKERRLKDQNKNKIGEYASNTELLNYIIMEGKKSCELGVPNMMSRLLYDFYPIGEKGNLVDACDYSYRVFVPEEPELQERYWLGIALPRLEDEWRGKIFSTRSYFCYSKLDMIFYTDENLLKVFTRDPLSAKMYQDPWTPRKIFFEEPFKTPIDTSIWKVLDSSHLIGLHWSYKKQ